MFCKTTVYDAPRLPAHRTRGALRAKLMSLVSGFATQEHLGGPRFLLQGLGNPPSIPTVVFDGVYPGWEGFSLFGIATLLLCRMISHMGSFAAVQSRGVIALPPAIRRKFQLDRPGSQVEIVEEAGRIVLIPKVAVDASQSWFWSGEWQAGEREASHQLSRGEGITYESGEAFLDALP